ncbi:MAG: C39 family peptidase [Bacillota bacterium]
MVGQFAKNRIKFFVNLLVAILILNLLIVFSSGKVKYYKTIINAFELRTDLNSRHIKTDINKLITKNIKLSAKQKLVTNKRVRISGAVSSDIKEIVAFSSNTKSVYRSGVEENNSYQIEMSFTTPGIKTITIVGINNKGEAVKQLIKKVNIKEIEKHIINNVPYFYQYHNLYFPDSSCQNTAIAMILNYYGWRGQPDQITKKFGKDLAQSAGGFTNVFNYYAGKYNLNIRIRNNVNISPHYIESLLQQGKPVVAHGKFTGSGHIIVLLGFDEQYYYANDPAGKWDQRYRGDYKQRTATNGKYVKYEKNKLLKAMERDIGLWIHEVYFVSQKQNKT